MNKKVLATAGIAALAVSVSVAKADEVTTNGQVSTTASVSSTATQAIPTQSQVETAREQANAASQAVSHQESVVANHEETINQAKANLATADANLQKAQTAAYEASLEDIAVAQGQVTRAENAAEKKAQEELAAAQAAYKEKATAISSKEEQLTADQNAANQAKVAYETAQTVANEKAVALAAEAAKRKAESSTTNIRQKFTVSSEYISALKIYESKTSTAEEKYQAEQTLKDVNKRDRENNKYQDNEADKNITISDLNKLSEAQITDLSLYASSLINQIRSAFGTTETSVSKGSVIATDRVTDGYVADNWGWESISNRRHDSAALACAGKSFNTVNIGENLNTWQGLTGPFTLNQIKEYTYEAMLDFMFNGQEWNHARSIAGLTSDGGETYIGTDLSVVAGAFNVHVNNINENSISFDSSFDTTKIANPYEGSQSQPSSNANLAAAKVAYETAKQANDQAQSDLASKKAASESATLKLKNTQSELTALKATASKLRAAQTNLSEKQAGLKQANQALAFAKNRVAALTNASANLAKAKAERAIAFAKLTAAKGALSIERAKLVELSAKRDKLTSEYTTVQTAFDNYMKAKADKERQTQLSKEFSKITSKGLIPVSIYDVDGKVVALTTQEQTAQTVAQVPVNYGQTKAEKQAPVQAADSLPETGESTAAGFSLVGLFMTLLAFLGFVDRRTRRN
ncbi:SEC10/PgrA surface exclusion domain-containing protein [uncultured Streptococcus sp.]|uniref:SEC10/PgrA surface exclusion domain-containing protein n=1 Tax=uncultured Streptococcus sp. TaxID=83427 RepID=UPI0025D413D3|nr:SEC10/PgrA surface exclusion domain-containing protein [uncultured Streptococcus sp.]